MAKKLLILTLVMLFCISFTSCKKADKNTIRVGIAMAHFDDVFLSFLRESMEDYAKKTDGLEVVSQDAKGDVGIQLSQVENFIAQDMNAIIVNPADTQATKKMTEKAVAAGIPIIFVNRKPEIKLPDGAYFVGSDEVSAGNMQMEYLAKMMNGKGNLAIILGELSSVGTHGRTEGVKEVLKNYPGIKIVEEQTANFMRDEALDLMTNWLSSGKKINAVAANNDEMALGAILAIKNAKLKPNKDIFVGGVDATPDALKAVEKGELTVTIFQDAKGQGLGAIESAYKLAKGEKVEKNTWIPFQLVTAENYKEFLNK
jgi:inositol transport system substrate-binding protein